MSDNDETDGDYDWTRHGYIYRRLIETDGTHVRVGPKEEKWDENEIRLFRYVEKQWEGPVRAFSWWSELETDVPRFAGEATGIPDACCVWRLEWTLARDEAKAVVRCGRRRASSVGWFFEYENLHAVSADRITWYEMEPIPFT